MTDELTSTMPRRGFLGSTAAAALGIGVAGLIPTSARAETTASADAQLEAWFGRLTGKHRAVFDAPHANDGMPAVWPRVYLMTTTGTYPADGASAMLIIRHEALALAFQDHIWAKYHLGEMFNIKNGAAPAIANPYAKITTLPLPDLGITGLLKTGVLIGACDVAITVYSGAAATKMKMDAAAVKKEWIAGLYPGIQIVPSGVMAVARAQEFSAQYVFAG
ncbi:MAG TPA: hypothetical protein VHW65_11090 [Gemmatimonadales bacterium]|jgi:hypothetical protein|nr:hypothetical protein [Gemmatimonadales bacterium]